MMRILKTGPFPAVGKILDNVHVVTPHRAAALAFGLTSRSLHALASEILLNSGISIASQIDASVTLKQAISATVSGGDPKALAVRIKQILETVLRTGIDIDALEAHGSSQVKQLARIAREYQRRLRGQNLVDNAEVVWQAATLKPEPQPLCIYGYFRARKEEIFFINAIAGEGSVFYLPCHGNPIFKGNLEWANWLESHGQWKTDRSQSEPVGVGEVAARRFTDLGAIDPKIQALAYRNAELEVGGVLSECKRLINGGLAPGEIAIVTRDFETYPPLISALSCEYGVPVEMRHRLPLNSTLVGSFIALLIRAANTGLEFETTARLLMHPFGPGLAGNAWPSARKIRTNGAAAWGQIAGDISCLEWLEEATLSTWIDCLTGALQTLKIRRRAGEVAREIVAFNLFLKSLNELRVHDPDRQTGRDQFSLLVEELLANIQVPFEPSIGGVAFHNPDTISGAAYKQLFVIGMAEGMLPGAVVDNAVIDFYERRKLNQYGIEFEEAAEVARWSALSFYFTLLTAAENISLSYPVTVDGAEKIANAYFASLGVEPKLVDITSVSSIAGLRHFLLRTTEDAGSDATLGLARKQFAIERSRESVEIADEYDGAIGIKIDPYQASWSASQFTSIGQCPFKWFAQKLLKLRPADETETKLSPAMKGSLYHKVLELAVEHAKDVEDIRTSALEVLDVCFERAEADEKLGLPVLPNWGPQRNEHLRALRKAVRSDAFLEVGARVVAVEQLYETRWDDFTITGRIDRIDETAEGLIAIDYKTSSSVSPGVKNAAGKTLVDIQLSLYSTVALPALYPGKSVKKGIYYSLTKGKVLKKIEPPDSSSITELVNTVRRILDAGRFVVDPDVDGNACKYCDFDRLCRKGSRLDRKSKRE
ncbi:MAG: PD-(D/E)XK nuclease family protein [Chloracidobacterium sp.]|nr:PD-(D/E)XK nuclease family protein [Chloracidobacterium sp.]